ncbi:MAG: hypothetical protein J5784_00835 [Muribaculaceae bacterium]|nr:hypothetical protein [Muribaculaceae bacterium]
MKLYIYSHITSVEPGYLSIPLEQGLAGCVAHVPALNADIRYTSRRAKGCLRIRCSRTGAVAPTCAARSDELKVETSG